MKLLHTKSSKLLINLSLALCLLLICNATLLANPESKIINLDFLSSLHNNARGDLRSKQYPSMIRNCDEIINYINSQKKIQKNHIDTLNHFYIKAVILKAAGHTYLDDFSQARSIITDLDFFLDSIGNNYAKINEARCRLYNVKGELEFFKGKDNKRIYNVVMRNSYINLHNINGRLELLEGKENKGRIHYELIKNRYVNSYEYGLKAKNLAKYSILILLDNTWSFYLEDKNKTEENTHFINEQIQKSKKIAKSLNCKTLPNDIDKCECFRATAMHQRKIANYHLNLEQLKETKRYLEKARKNIFRNNCSLKSEYSEFDELQSKYEDYLDSVKNQEEKIRNVRLKWIIIGLSISCIIFLYYYFSERKAKERAVHLSFLEKKTREEAERISVIEKKAREEAEFLKAEMNHRVKNNLQSIASSVKTRKRQLNPRDDKKIIQILNIILGRIQTSLLLHSELQKHHEVESIYLKPYIELLLRYFKDVYDYKESDYNFKIDIPSEVIVKKIQTQRVGRIINELVSNASKYSPHDRKVLKCIARLEQDKQTPILIIEVIDKGEEQEVIEKKNYIGGSQIVLNLIKKLKGNYNYKPNADSIGRHYTIQIPLNQLK